MRKPRRRRLLFFVEDASGSSPNPAKPSAARGCARWARSRSAAFPLSLGWGSGWRFFARRLAPSRAERGLRIRQNPPFSSSPRDVFREPVGRFSSLSPFPRSSPAPHFPRRVSSPLRDFLGFLRRLLLRRWCRRFAVLILRLRLGLAVLFHAERFERLLSVGTRRCRWRARHDHGRRRCHRRRESGTDHVQKPADASRLTRFDELTPLVRGKSRERGQHVHRTLVTVDEESFHDGAQRAQVLRLTLAMSCTSHI